MIETRPALVERLSAVQIRELSETDECAARKPSDTLERTCVLVKDRVRAEQSLVPRHTPFEARHRQRHVSNRRELWHVFSAPREGSECLVFWLATLCECAKFTNDFTNAQTASVFDAHSHL